MHSNATSIQYAVDLAQTSPTVINNLIKITPAKSKINLHDRKLVAVRVVKKLPGRRDPGAVMVECEYEKTQHSAIETLHKGFTEKFWQINYSDSAKDKLGNCIVSEFSGPDVNEDNQLVTTFELTCIDADDDYTTS